VEETPPPGILAISRRGLLKSGLIAGLGVAGLSAASTALTTGVARASVTTSIYVDPDYDYDPLNPDWETATVQTEWAYCVRCRNLYYAGEGGSATFGGACAWDNYQGAPNTPHYSPSSSTKTCSGASACRASNTPKTLKRTTPGRLSALSTAAPP
jgi:hypothetical protein